MYLLALAFAGVLLGQAFSEPAVDVEKERAVADNLASLKLTGARVEERLRGYLFANGDVGSSSTSAINQLIADLRTARIVIRRIANTVAGSHELLIKDGGEMLGAIDDICANLHYNESCAEHVMPTIRDGPRLALADQDHGAFDLDADIQDRSYDELSRLLFVATVRPKMLASTGPDVGGTGPLPDGQFATLKAQVMNVFESMNGDYGRASRKAAADLWLLVHDVAGNPAKYGGEERSLSPRQTDSALVQVRETIKQTIKEHDDFVAGKRKVKAPFLEQEVTFAMLSRLAPFASAAFLVLTALIFAKSALLIDRVEAADRPAIPTSLPLIGHAGATFNEAPASLLTEVLLLLLPATLCWYFAGSETSHGGAVFAATGLATMGLLFAWAWLRRVR